ncbi:MAG: hypothetical protein ACI8P3_000871 [Saprospiraceae bacterium]|jgi:hypothetical protein
MNKIRLIGISGDQQYESWRVKVSKVLQDLGLGYKLEEVNEVDEIVSYNIRAIPALLIGDTVLIEQHNHVLDFEEIKASILGYLGTRDLH